MTQNGAIGGATRTPRLAAIQRRRIAFWDAIHAFERTNRTGGHFAKPTWEQLRALYRATARRAI